MMLRSAKVACMGALLITGLGSCGGAELGDCDWSQLGGSPGGATPMPYNGQVLLQSSCGAGRCHSSYAAGDVRFGAPAELDFNVVPRSTSAEDRMTARGAFGVVSNNIDEIWGEIEEGSMPPPPPAGSGALKDADKAVIRNWLACGAPVIDAPAQAAADADPWTRIYTLLGPQCVGCHSAGTKASGGGFVFGENGDACGAYKNVREVATQAGGACGGRVLVKVGDPANSVLVQKLTAMNLCGSPMPLGASAAMPFASTNATLVDELQKWITAGAMPPAGCQ